MNLEEEMLKIKAEEMARAMDGEIICSLLKDTGYREIVVDPWVHGSLKEITAWIDENVQGHYVNAGNRWLFEESKDATIFALKWG